MTAKSRKGFRANVPYKNGFAGEVQRSEVLYGVLTTAVMLEVAPDTNKG